MQTMLDHLREVSGFGKVVKTFTINGWPIRLYQHPTRKQGSYAVQYGKQLDHHLGYSGGAAKLGEAILHALATEGELDNGRD